MICPQCRHENPAGNRFCGSCGTKLPVADAPTDPKAPSSTWLKSMEENKPNARELEAQRVEAEHAAREREIAERAERAARREREIAERAARAKAAAVQPQQQPATRSVSTAGPSFLGLSGSYEPEQAEEREERAEEYEPSDIYGGGRSYTRALLLLVLLLVVAGLAFMQWRYSSGLRASSSADKPSATQPEQTGADDKQAANESSNAKSEDALPQKDQTSASSSTENKSNGKSQSVNNPNDEEAPSAPEEPRTGKMQPPAEPQQQAANPGEPATPAQPKSGSKAASVPDKATDQAESKPPARVRAKPQPQSEVSDEPVRLAESYIYGRGLPQSCPQAVSILREASNRGNYKAQIKLGALYATGNCVTLDRVQAYRFLTRALQGKPGNTWVEQNRSMLWAQMNEQERRQAMEQNF